MPRSAAPAVAATKRGPGTWLEWGVPLALTALAYLAVAAATIPIATAPACASPLYPAAGVALASVLAFGRRMLAGVLLGALAANLLLDDARGLHGAAAIGVPLALAFGASLQAGFAAALARRFARQPLTLTQPRDVAGFVAACTAGSIVAAGVAVLTLAAVGVLVPAKALTTWATWWIGDFAGLVIVTPIVLTLIGRPRGDWAPRRIAVGLTMTLVVAFLSLGIYLGGRWNDERQRALEALRGVFSVNRHLSGGEMRRVTAPWLGSRNVAAMGWTERVRRDEVAAFEQHVRAEGGAGYRVFDRSDDPPAPARGGADANGSGSLDAADVMAIRLIEPMAGNDAALGVNSLSVAPARAAILQAIDTGAPAASASFRLAQQASDDKRAGVVIYQAIYDGDPANAVSRRAAVRGMVFVTLAMDSQLAGLAGKVPDYLRLCVVEAEQGALRRHLSGPPGCEADASGPFARDHSLLFAGRQWDLRVSADPDDIPNGARRNAWILSTVGLLSAAMLGVSLLITTGRTRRIESAVRERTAALRAEVGERHVAEMALRASEQRFRNILDNVPIGVVYTDLAGRVIQANPRYCELTGYSESELEALSPAALAHPDDLAADEMLTAQLIAGEIPMYRRHKRCFNRAGDVVWVRSTVSVLRDAQNEPWRIVAVVEDITEHLRLEDAERAREAAEASNRAKSDFLSRMSHELRTPLNAMLGFAQLLEIDRRHPLTPTQRPWVSQIQQAGWHLLEMINDVLDLSRIDSGNLRLQTTTLDLAELVEATTALVASDAAKRGIRISRELTPGTSAVLGDATRVKQILTNLLSNAVKYNIENGRVHIGSRLAGPDVIEVSVTDTGMGMTPEQMEELFRPFNRLGRERTALQGTGIGLVISRRLAELMGGSIRVKSVPGEGSSFILKLPKAIDPDTVRSSLDDLEALPADYHRRIVHYVEDNETNVEVMRGILAQRAQVQMEVSVTGLDGLAAVRARMPHLILLDMQLPDISGLELLRHLKADPATALIPVIVVSADATAQQVDAALDAGAVRYLTKPVAVNELLATIDDLLDRMDTGFS
jgi:PAS domain S-box-containing protein